MNALLLSQLSVPCKTSIRRVDQNLSTDKGIYYLNPKVMIRYEPNGAVIIPEKFYLSQIYIDNDMVSLLKKRMFSIYSLSNDIVDLLLKNMVIGTDFRKVMSYSESYVYLEGLPIHAFLEVTNRCNCNCNICYQRDDIGAWSDPPVDELVKRVEHLYRLGIRLIEVTGGEALLRRDLSKVFARILSLGMNFYVVTNGEYIKQINFSMMNLLRKSLGVIISIDGIGATHDTIRSRSGLYAKALAGMDYLRQNRVAIYIVSTISESNRKDIPGLVDLAQKYGAIVQFRPVINTGAAVLNKVSGSSPYEYSDLLEGKNVFNQFLSIKKEISPSRYYGCSSHRIGVDVRGNILPCVMDRSRKMNKLIDLDQAGLFSLLERGKRVSLEMNSSCRHCKMNKDMVRCGGFCSFSKSYRNGLNQ